ncbi:2-oxo-4-hydroxy-4-carboxy-5-ureidoimidazoline decarboxylase [Ensifer sp. MJa1]|uniref:2-oxo-4-hydroxy-4-carboxy-5-ureidoimidazoline decarboxylase n=1 Tax=Ensifer sp. MJa1 TaxID=2919888 RepID=UPI00300B354E
MSDRDAFVARYGGVFEHSPWVAERAFDRAAATGLMAGNVDSALCQAFRTALPREKMQVLRAHPDLAGKLAIAGKLTADSTAEQAGAGLDRLTAEEHQRFTALNEAYMKKFGFPFIIAVKGLNKDQILVSFESRIDNSPEEEFETACAQVEKIARLRLQSMLPGDENA